MKKLLIVIIVAIELCILDHKIEPAFIEKVNLKMKTNELAISFLFDDNKTILLSTTDINILIIIESSDSKKLNSVLKKFNASKIDYINDINKSTYDDYVIGNITIKKQDNNIQINYLNNDFCICQNDFVFSKCDYIYLVNPSENTTFINDPKLVLYDKLNDDFIEKMYDKWVDTYYLDTNNYNIVKINSENYNIINIPTK